MKYNLVFSSELLVKKALALARGTGEASMNAMHASHIGHGASAVESLANSITGADALRELTHVKPVHHGLSAIGNAVRAPAQALLSKAPAIVQNGVSATGTGANAVSKFLGRIAPPVWAGSMLHGGYKTIGTQEGMQDMQNTISNAGVGGKIYHSVSNPLGAIASSAAQIPGTVSAWQYMNSNELAKADAAREAALTQRLNLQRMSRVTAAAPAVPKNTAVARNMNSIMRSRTTMPSL